MLNDLFCDSIIIQTFTPGTSWGDKGAWTDESIVTGRMRTLTRNEQKINDKGIVISTHRFYFSAGVDVTEKKRIIINGENYDVRSVVPRRVLNGDTAFLEVDAKYVERNEVETS